MSIIQNLPKPVVFSQEFNPMLAAEGVLGKMRYPKLALDKQNGVRAANQKGDLLARSLKPIPNLYTRRLYSGPELINLEGELVVGDPYDEEVFSHSTSGVMSRYGSPDVRWFLFDFFHPTAPFQERLYMRDHLIADLQHPHLEGIGWRVLHSDEDLIDCSEDALRRGLEGIVVRDPNSTYKEGRSTAKEEGFMRFCPWLKSEAVILEIHEGEVNLNQSKVNELGYLKKSSHKANKVGSGRAGAITVQDLVTGIQFNMPVPTVKLQETMWANPELFISKLAKYKFKPAVKIGGKPRFPQYEGLRSTLDM